MAMIRNNEISATKEIYLWMGLNLIDFVLTSVAFVFGAIEANLVMRLFGINGVWELFVWKIALVCGILVFLGTITIPYAKNQNILYLTNRIMIVVCVWNLVVLSICAVRG